MTEDLDPNDLELLVGDIREPIGDDTARHIMLGLMVCVSRIGIHAPWWDALSTAHPKLATLGVLMESVTSRDSLEFAQLSDIVEDAVPFAEGWLRDWLRDHGVPYILGEVPCPAHGVFLYAIGNEDTLAADGYTPGLTRLF